MLLNYLNSWITSLTLVLWSPHSEYILSIATSLVRPLWTRASTVSQTIFLQQYLNQTLPLCALLNNLAGCIEHLQHLTHRQPKEHTSSLGRCTDLPSEPRYSHLNCHLHPLFPEAWFTVPVSPRTSLMWTTCRSSLAWWAPILQWRNSQSLG